MKRMKKIIIISVLLAVVAAISIVTVLVLKKKNRDKKTVDVFYMGEVGSPGEYMTDNEETFSGSVYTDAEQKIYLTSTDIVSKVNVKVGDTVKAGDIILEYDMTVQKLNIESKTASVEIARTNILAVERQLKELKNTIPVEPTTDDFLASASDAVADIKTYTKKELEDAIADKNKELESLKLEYQRQQLELELLKYEQKNGGVMANFDGVITEVKDSEEAILNNEPYITLNAQSGYTVRCSMPENKLGSIKYGDSVYMYCYDNGMSYTGTIQDISNIPSDEYGYDDFQTYYPVTIAVDDATDMAQGMYLDVTFSHTSNEMDSSVGIPLAFVRKEHGNYYVYKEVDGKLKKVYVKTGKIVWGDQIIIKSGVTLEDYLAIPYSKNASEGVKTVHQETDRLYD